MENDRGTTIENNKEQWRTIEAQQQRSIKNNRGTTIENNKEQWRTIEAQEQM